MNLFRPCGTGESPAPASPSHKWLGYYRGAATQRPVALLKQIIQVSSPPCVMVLDPHFGCGKTIAAAEKLGYQWIGINITALAFSLNKRRLPDTYGSRLKFVTGGTQTLSPTGAAASGLPLPKGEGMRVRGKAASAAASPVSPHLDRLPQGEGEKLGCPPSGEGAVSLVRIIGKRTTPCEATPSRIDRGQSVSGCWPHAIAGLTM